jgi:hypothetical protein
VGCPLWTLLLPARVLADIAFPVHFLAVVWVLYLTYLTVRPPQDHRP